MGLHEGHMGAAHGVSLIPKQYIQLCGGAGDVTLVEGWSSPGWAQRHPRDIGTSLGRHEADPAGLGMPQDLQQLETSKGIGDTHRGLCTGPGVTFLQVLHSRSGIVLESPDTAEAGAAAVTLTPCPLTPTPVSPETAPRVPWH